MNLGGLRRPTRQAWVVLLLLPALGLRVSVPEGFMPAGDGAHPLTMQMCHGDPRSSAVIRLSGETGDATDEAPEAQRHGSCPYAAGASAAPPALPAGVSALAPPDASAPLGSPAAAVVSTRHRSQSPRAPPSVA
jgi:hypothetical protein